MGSDAVTVLALKPIKRLFVIELFVLVIFAVAVLLGIHGISFAPGSTLEAKGKLFSLETMTSDTDRARGLSGRDSIAQDAAMLFVFDGEDKRCFWMKDMKFSIDMVWLDSHQKVVAIEPNIAPDSYPKSFCYDGAQYVVEFSANTGASISLKPGDRLAF